MLRQPVNPENLTTRLDIDNHSLVEECKVGNQEALNLFYTRFASRMLRVIHRYIQDPQDSEDILHDGFIAAFTHLDSIRDADHVDYWLTTIMKNLSLQFLKSQDLVQILHEIPEKEDEAPYPEDFIDLDTLEILIKKLPPGYQKVFRLAVLENKTHKEIGKLLGIAPNSSSSQLFHAKLMMRKLIIEYRGQAGIFSILAILICGGIFLWREGNAIFSPNIAESPDNPLPERNKITLPDTTAEIPSAPAYQSSPVAANITAKPHITTFAKNPGTPDNLPDSTIHNLSAGTTAPRTDYGDKDGSLSERRTSTVDLPGEETLYTYEPIHDSRPLRKEWTVGIGMNTGILNFDKISSGSDYAANGSSGSETDQNNPNKPDDDTSGNQSGDISTRSRNRQHYMDYDNVSHHNYIPISFSLTVNKRLSDKFGVESGLTYTYLHSRFESASTTAHCHWHYLGVPLKLTFNNYRNGRLSFYAGVGGEIDIPLYSNSVLGITESFPDLKAGRFNSSVVWSLSASYGMSVTLTNSIDLFVEPTLQYHFDHHHTVPDIWTDNPWGFTLPIGFRFSF